MALHGRRVAVFDTGHKMSSCGRSSCGLSSDGGADLGRGADVTVSVGCGSHDGRQQTPHGGRDAFTVGHRSTGQLKPPRPAGLDPKQQPAADFDEEPDVELYVRGDGHADSSTATWGDWKYCLGSHHLLTSALGDR
jgi:hypothetical protein